MKRRDEAGHEGCDCLYLCAPKRWHWRGPYQLSQGAQSLRAPLGLLPPLLRPLLLKEDSAQPNS